MRFCSVLFSYVLLFRVVSSHKLNEKRNESRRRARKSTCRSFKVTPCSCLFSRETDGVSWASTQIKGSRAVFAVDIRGMMGTIGYLFHLISRPGLSYTHPSPSGAKACGLNSAGRSCRFRTMASRFPAVRSDPVWLSDAVLPQRGHAGGQGLY